MSVCSVLLAALEPQDNMGALVLSPAVVWLSSPGTHPVLTGGRRVKVLLSVLKLSGGRLQGPSGHLPPRAPWGGACLHKAHNTTKQGGMKVRNKSRKLQNKEQN